MSVINRVLKDLDRQGGQPAPLAPGIRSVPVQAASRPPVMLGLAMLAVGVTVWWLWPSAKETPSLPSPSTNQPAPGPRQDPLPPGPTPPRLRLSQELSLPVPSSAIPPPSPRETRPPPPEGRGPALPPPLPSPRLDTRLSEPASQPRPRVVKEIKPATPVQQAEALWLEAAALVEKGRGQAAQALLEQSLGLDPAHPKARQTLAVLALEAGRRAEAEALLREGASLHPGLVWFSRSLAQLHLQQGEYAQAAGVLKAGLGRQAEAADWALYAGTLAKLNRVEDAATAYREALRRDPSQGAWWIGLGVALEQGGHGAESRESFSRALQTRLSPELRDFAANKARE